MSKFASALLFGLIGAVVLGALTLAGGMKYAGTRGMTDYDYAIATLFYWTPTAVVVGALIGGVIGYRRGVKAV